MIRYLHDPENPQEPLVEATPKDIEQFRCVLRVHLRRTRPQIGDDGIEDVLQLVVIVACRAVPGGAVRGSYSNAPETVLRAWLTGVASRLGMNAKRRIQYRDSANKASAALDGVDERLLPDAVVEARQMVERLLRESHSPGIRALLLLAAGATHREVARESGISISTVFRQVRHARKQLALLQERGALQQPKLPSPSSLRSRKRKR